MTLIASEITIYSLKPNEVHQREHRLSYADRSISLSNLSNIMMYHRFGCLILKFILFESYTFNCITSLTEDTIIVIFENLIFQHEKRRFFQVFDWNEIKKSLLKKVYRVP